MDINDIDQSALLQKVSNKTATLEEKLRLLSIMNAELEEFSKSIAALQEAIKSEAV